MSVISVIESSLPTYCLSFLFLITLSKANFSYLSLITLFYYSLNLSQLDQTGSLTNVSLEKISKTNHANISNSSIPYFPM